MNEIAMRAGELHALMCRQLHSYSYIHILTIFTSSCGTISLGGRFGGVAAVNTLSGILTTVTIRTIAIQWTES